jgi:hypothetical protein
MMHTGSQLTQYISHFSQCHRGRGFVFFDFFITLSFCFSTLTHANVYAERYKNIGNMLYPNGRTAELFNQIVIIAVVIVLVHLDFSATHGHFTEPVPNAHKYIHPPVAVRNAF